MRYLNRKQLGELVGLTTSNVTNYVNRGKVLEDEVTGLIDAQNPVNTIFIQGRMNKIAAPAELPKGVTKRDTPKSKPTAPKTKVKAKPTAPKTKVKAKPVEVFADDDDTEADEDAVALFQEPGPFYGAAPPTAEGEDVMADGTPHKYISEARLKYQDSIKRTHEAELARLKVEKMLGQVIPSEMIGPVLTQLNQHMVASLKQGVDTMLTRIGKRYDVTPADRAEMNGYAVEIINEAQEKAIQSAIASVKNIVNEYAETRGVGERK